MFGAAAMAGSAPEQAPPPPAEPPAEAPDTETSASSAAAPAAKVTLLPEDWLRRKDGDRTREALSRIGVAVEAAFHMPPGPETRGQDSYLVVFSRKLDDQIFVARLGDDSEHNAEVLDNFLHRRAGHSVGQGFLGPDIDDRINGLVVGSHKTSYIPSAAMDRPHIMMVPPAMASL